MNGMPGPGGSLGQCAWCGKIFLTEILFGQKVPSFQIDQVNGDLFAHRKCLALLKKTTSIFDWPEESPVRLAILKHNEKTEIVKE